MGRRRKSTDNLMDTIVELTDIYWQIGAVASAIFALLGVYALKWAIAQTHPINPTAIDAAINNSAIVWIYYALPFFLFVIAITLVIRTIYSYQKHNRF